VKATIVKKIMILFVVCVVTSSVYFLMSAYYELRYPKNESRSRRDCSSQLKQISFLLHVFMEKNSGMMPTDFYELMSMNYKERRILLCPSQFTVADKKGFLEENSPVFISSYRLMVPGKNFYKLNDGTVIVKEFEGNHPESVVNKRHFSAGYHVIVKEGNDLKEDFINTCQSQN
jgi:hypothetical protein